MDVYKNNIAKFQPGVYLIMTRASYPFTMNAEDYIKNEIELNTITSVWSFIPCVVFCEQQEGTAKPQPIARSIHRKRLH